MKENVYTLTWHEILADKICLFGLFVKNIQHFYLLPSRISTPNSMTRLRAHSLY